MGRKTSTGSMAVAVAIAMVLTAAVSGCGRGEDHLAGCRSGRVEEQAEAGRQTQEAQGKSGGAVSTITIAWVDIPDSNAAFPAENRPSGSGFTGEMSRYPTTNAQYAGYLNAALGSGDVEVVGYRVRAVTGDYAGKLYYNLAEPDSARVGVARRVKPRITYEGGVFSVIDGFESHPVTYVYWEGAMAFARHYGWRLPSEWEWESVANYNDNRTYAIGGSLYDDQRFFANYRANGLDGCLPDDLPYHPYVEHGTTPAGFFGYYGYGLADMSGGVQEWTVDLFRDTHKHRVIRGGSWADVDEPCKVSSRHRSLPNAPCGTIGFRVCR